MQPLPPVIDADTRVLFCGLAGRRSSRTRDHYYANPTNAFWRLLHESGLTPERIPPERDHDVVRHGLGLTDVVRDTALTPAPWDVEALAVLVEQHRPEWVAFTAKGTGAGVARALGHRPSGLGPAEWTLAGADVFVLPGCSGANQRADYDGLPSRLAWWQMLADLVDA